MSDCLRLGPVLICAHLREALNVRDALTVCMLEARVYLFADCFSDIDFVESDQIIFYSSWVER